MAVSMIAPTAEHLLRVWEEQRDAEPLRRALAALAAAWPNTDSELWAGASVGQRDSALFGLQERLFGSQLRTTAECPDCGELVETEFAAADIACAAAAPPEEASRALRWQGGGFDVHYRLPTSQDLLAEMAQSGSRRSTAAFASAEMGPADDPADAATRLLRRCLLDAQRGDAAVDAAALPEAVVAGLGTEMEAHDPGADIQLGLHCPACGHCWDLRFDIVSYFWDELDDWAQRTLADVDALARAYGWTEAEILGLSAARRRVYLDFVNA